MMKTNFVFNDLNCILEHYTTKVQPISSLPN